LRIFMPDEKLDVVEDYEYELSDIEIQQLKEHNQRRVKRVVALVAVLMTLLALGLVTMSLALGNRIDMMGMTTTIGFLEGLMKPTDPLDAEEPREKRGFSQSTSAPKTPAKSCLSFTSMAKLEMISWQEAPSLDGCVIAVTIAGSSRAQANGSHHPCIYHTVLRWSTRISI
ncbi:hypothetical protein TELCIR_16192, partial [Teladorsagia circumcincta]